jgi:hypothetical protein
LSGVYRMTVYSHLSTRPSKVGSVDSVPAVIV